MAMGDSTTLPPPASRGAVGPTALPLGDDIFSASRPVQIVVNPRAGAGRALAIARRLQDELRARGHPARTLVLGGAAETGRWARSVRGDFGCLFCVGGDATLDAVAPAAMRLGVPLVPVPAGFGNVFARVLGHHGRRGEYARLLEGSMIRWLDAGVNADGAFLCSRSLGLLDRVERAVEETGSEASSWSRRYLAYVRAAWRVLREEPLPEIQVEVDGNRVAEGAAMVIVANVPAYHGFLNLMPAASPDDGLLDVLVVPRTTKRRLLRDVIGAALRIPWMAFHSALYCRGKRVVLSCNGGRPLEFTVLHRALPVLVPGPFAGPSKGPRLLHGKRMRVSQAHEKQPKKSIGWRKGEITGQDHQQTTG